MEKGILDTLIMLSCCGFAVHRESVRYMKMRYIPIHTRRPLSPVAGLVKVYEKVCPLNLTLNSDRRGFKLKKKWGKYFGSRQFFAKG